MSVKFEAVLDGAAKYIDNEIFPRMTDWQEVIARVFVGRIFENREAVKTVLVNNGIIRTFGVIDEDGNVDIERLAEDVKKEVDKKTKVSVDIPLFGSMKFRSADIDKLVKFITESAERGE